MKVTRMNQEITTVTNQYFDITIRGTGNLFAILGEVIMATRDNNDITPDMLNNFQDDLLKYGETILPKYGISIKQENGQ